MLDVVTGAPAPTAVHKVRNSSNQVAVVVVMNADRVAIIVSNLPWPICVRTASHVRMRKLASACQRPNLMPKR